MPSDGDAARHRRKAHHQRKEPIMLNGKKIMAAVLRGLEVSGTNALAQAGYSESTLKAFEAIEQR